MSLQCRKSTGLDVLIIDDLLQECFGEREQYGALDNLESRYMLCFDNDKLVGMTGLMENSLYCGAEIDWTCILPKYRGRGIITNMIKEIIKDCDKDIYCSCWRQQDNKKINLHHAMETLGFVPALVEHKKYNSLHTDVCKHCVNKKSNECYCQEDLYVKYHKKGK